MSTITITVNDDTKTTLLSEMLKAMDFVESVEVDDDSDFTAEELQMVEERWENYQRNPGSGKSWEEVYRDLKTKYGK